MAAGAGEQVHTLPDEITDLPAIQVVNKSVSAMPAKDETLTCPVSIPNRNDAGHSEGNKPVDVDKKNTKSLCETENVTNAQCDNADETDSSDRVGAESGFVSDRGSADPSTNNVSESSFTANDTGTDLNTMDVVAMSFASDKTESGMDTTTTSKYDDVSEEENDDEVDNDVDAASDDEEVASGGEELAGTDNAQAGGEDGGEDEAHPDGGDDDADENNVLHTPRKALKRRLVDVECPECEKLFISYDHLKRHLRDHAREKAKAARAKRREVDVNCSVCGKHFKRMDHLRRHEQSHENKKRYKGNHRIVDVNCTECGKHFKRMDHLKRHQQSHEKQRAIKEAKAKLREEGVDPTAADLETPEEKSKKKSRKLIDIYCEVCGKYFNRMDHLRRHESVHMTEKPHRCHLCEMAFTRPEHLKRHIRKHDHKCERCNKTFSKAELLEKHQLSHLFKCEFCSERFETKDGLKEHLVLHKDEMPNVCDICGKRFHLRKQLQNHKEVHKAQDPNFQPFTCEICGHLCKTKKLLYRHQVGHTGRRDFMCQICGKAFKVRVDLTKHNIIHFGTRKHKCHLCGKGFFQKKDLKRHYTIHGDATPFKCEICNKGFKVRYNYNMHLFTHSGKHPFECKFCLQHFRSGVKLKAHLQSHPEYRQQTELLGESLVDMKMIKPLHETLQQPEANQNTVTPLHTPAPHDQAGSVAPTPPPGVAYSENSSHSVQQQQPHAMFAQNINPFARLFTDPDQNPAFSAQALFGNSFTGQLFSGMTSLPTAYPYEQRAAVESPMTTNSYAEESNRTMVQDAPAASKVVDNALPNLLTEREQQSVVYSHALWDWSAFEESKAKKKLVQDTSKQRTPPQVNNAEPFANDDDYSDGETNDLSFDSQLPEPKTLADIKQEVNNDADYTDISKTFDVTVTTSTPVKRSPKKKVFVPDSELPKLVMIIPKGSTVRSTQCPECNKTLSRFDHLRTHVRNVHSKALVVERGDVKKKEEKSKTCTICWKDFGRPDHLTRHLRLVHKQDIPKRTPERRPTTEHIEIEIKDRMENASFVLISADDNCGDVQNKGHEVDSARMEAVDKKPRALTSGDNTAIGEGDSAETSQLQAAEHTSKVTDASGAEFSESSTILEESHGADSSLPIGYEGQSVLERSGEEDESTQIREHKEDVLRSQITKQSIPCNYDAENAPESTEPPADGLDMKPSRDTENGLFCQREAHADSSEFNPRDVSGEMPVVINQPYVEIKPSIKCIQEAAEEEFPVRHKDAEQSTSVEADTVESDRRSDDAQYSSQDYAGVNDSGSRRHADVDEDTMVNGNDVDDNRVGDESISGNNDEAVETSGVNEVDESAPKSNTNEDPSKTDGRAVEEAACSDASALVQSTGERGENEDDAGVTADDDALQNASDAGENVDDSQRDTLQSDPAGEDVSHNVDDAAQDTADDTDIPDDLSEKTVDLDMSAISTESIASVKNEDAIPKEMEADKNTGNSQSAAVKRAKSNRVCPICGKKFGRTDHLTRHLKNVHKQDMPRKGKPIAKPDRKLKPMILKIKGDTTPRVIKCPVCDKELGRMRALIQHCERVHLMLITISRNAPYKPIRTGVKNQSQPKVFKCQICEKSFKRKDHLTRHTRSHSGDKPFQCDRCPMAFTRKEYLDNHLHTHSPKCELCDHMFGGKIELKQHLIECHENDRPNICDICGRGFQLKVQLTNHLKTHKPESNIKTYTCEICGQCFRQKRLLERHHVGHTGRRDFICQVCGKAFKMKVDLYKHSVYHSSVKNYQCPKCPLAFYQSKDLRRHIFNHSDVKPHKCEICHRAFKNKQNLKVHVYTHTGKKPHQCKFCMQSFRSGVKLQTHLYTHPEYKPPQPGEHALMQPKYENVPPVTTLPDPIETPLPAEYETSVPLPAQTPVPGGVENPATLQMQRAVENLTPAESPLPQAYENAVPMSAHNFIQRTMETPLPLAAMNAMQRAMRSPLPVSTPLQRAPENALPPEMGSALQRTVETPLSISAVNAMQRAMENPLSFTVGSVMQRMEQPLPLTTTGLQRPEQPLSLTTGGLQRVEQALPQTTVSLQRVEQPLSLTTAGLQRADQPLSLTTGNLPRTDQPLPLTTSAINYPIARSVENPLASHAAFSASGQNKVLSVPNEYYHENYSAEQTRWMYGCSMLENAYLLQK